MSKSDSIKKILIVTGTFCKEGGKPSYFGQKIFESFEKIPYDSIKFINGGNYDCLSIEFSKINSYDIIFWMPHIEDSVNDYLPCIKRENKTAILIQARRNDHNCYTTFQIVEKMFSVRSNICLEFSKSEDSKYTFRVLDPLGNLWYSGDSITEASDKIVSHVSNILTLTRLPSYNSLATVPTVRIEKSFIRAVQFYGWRFSELVNIEINKERFTGNASTRCMAGFPSVRNKDSIFVSMRNVDKNDIGENNFIPVNLAATEVQYAGQNKPSVDTPVQLLLYRYYYNVNYIIHGHAYIIGAPFTEKFIPCGYLEEADEVNKVFKDHLSSNFAINLIGHGCLILAKNISYFAELGMVAREFPECHEIIPI